MQSWWLKMKMVQGGRRVGPCCPLVGRWGNACQERPFGRWVRKERSHRSGVAPPRSTRFASLSICPEPPLLNHQSSGFSLSSPEHGTKIFLAIQSIWKLFLSLYIPKHTH